MGERKLIVLLVPASAGAFSFDIIRVADFPAALPRGSAKESLKTLGFQLN
jgi:hypothetical protein